jgi:hypothetical protein
MKVVNTGRYPSFPHSAQPDARPSRALTLALALAAHMRVRSPSIGLAEPGRTARSRALPFSLADEAIPPIIPLLTPADGHPPPPTAISPTARPR